MALDAQAQRSLSCQFENRTVQKRYECIVDGHPESDDGMIDSAATLESPNRSGGDIRSDFRLLMAFVRTIRAMM